MSDQSAAGLSTGDWDDIMRSEMLILMKIQIGPVDGMVEIRSIIHLLRGL